MFTRVLRQDGSKVSVSHRMMRGTSGRGCGRSTGRPRGFLTPKEQILDEKDKSFTVFSATNFVAVVISMAIFGC